MSATSANSCSCVYGRTRCSAWVGIAAKSAGGGELGDAGGAQPREILPRMVGRPGQRRGHDQQKTFGQPKALVAGKFFRGHKARNRVMLWRRLQILPDGQEIDIRRAQ